MRERIMAKICRERINDADFAFVFLSISTPTPLTRARMYMQTKKNKTNYILPQKEFCVDEGVQNEEMLCVWIRCY